MVKVYDIKNNPNPEIEHKFFNVVNDIIENCSDKLSANYINMKEKYVDFASFTVAVGDEGDIIGFSGLQTFNFPAGHSRALTRTFYTKHFRKQSLGPRELPNLASKYMLPVQLEVAKKLQLDHVFISFEERFKREKFAKKFTNMLATEYPDENWELLHGVYNTIPHTTSKSWQHIVNNRLTRNEFNLEKRT